jgi:hypothetical protein
MNVDDLPVPKLAAAETERESAIEAILSDTKTAMTMSGRFATQGAGLLPQCLAR